MGDLARMAKREATRGVYRALLWPVRFALFMLGGVFTALADSPRYPERGRPRSGREEARQVTGAVLWQLVPAAVTAAPLWALLLISAVAVFVGGRRMIYSEPTASPITSSMPRGLASVWVWILSAAAIAAAPVAALVFNVGWLWTVAATAAGSAVFSIALTVARRTASRGAASRDRVVDALHVALSVPREMAEQQLRFRKGVWTMPAPAIARHRAANAGELDIHTAAILPQHTISVVGERITVQPADSEALARRELVIASGGLVVAAESRGGATTLTLADGVTPAAADRVAAFAAARFGGASLTEWAPFDRRAVVRELDPEVAAARTRIAAQLKAHQHEVEINQTSDNDGHRTLSFSAPQLLSADRVARRRIASELKASLEPAEGLTWRTKVDDATGNITMHERRDPLEKLITIDDFRRQHPLGADPATSWKSFDVAVTEDAAPVPFTLFHTLCVGQTGAGKGSVVWSILSGVLPTATEGLAEIYAIDPKGAEALADDGSPRGMFRQVATTPDEWAALVASLVEKMNSRKGQGRSLNVTPEQPLIVLFIDELSAVSALDTDTKRAKQVMSDLLLIASQGRSLNVLLVTAVQAPQKEMLGQLRQFMPMRVALRTETTVETDLVLGAGATDFGAEAHLIPVASPGNGYKSAGVGFVRIDGVPEPQRVRFPYTDDATLDRWDAEFRELRASGKLPPQITTDITPEPSRPRFGEVIETPAPEPEIDLGELDIDIDLDLDPTPPPPAVSTAFDDLFDD